MSVLRCYFVMMAVSQVTSLNGLPLNVETASLGFFTPNSQLSLLLGAPAYDMAVEEVNGRYLGLLNFSQVTYVFDTQLAGGCFQLYDNADFLLSRWYYTKRHQDTLPVLILPGCVAGATVNYLTASWNMLTVFSGDPPLDMDNRAKSSSSISTAYVSNPTIVLAFLNLITLYRWKSVFVVLDDGAVPVYRGAFSAFLDANVQIPGHRQSTAEIPSGNGTASVSKDILEEFHNVSRVLLFFGHAATLRTLLISASLLNMTDGQYVYVTMEPYRMPVAYGNLTWQYHDEYDEVARGAFRSLIVIQSDDSDRDLSMRATELGREFQKRSAINYSYPYPMFAQPRPVLFAGYQSVLMVAQILNETLNRGLDSGSGAVLANRFLNRQFNSDVIDMFIGLNGSRVPTLVFCQYGKNSSFLKPFLKQPANATSELVSLAEPEWLFDSRAQWPPPDEPHCGYRGEKEICKPQVASFSALYYGVPVGLVALLSLTFISLWKSGRLHRREAPDSWWILEHKLLVIAVAGFRDRHLPESHIATTTTTMVTASSAVVRIRQITNPRNHRRSRWKLVHEEEGNRQNVGRY